MFNWFFKKEDVKTIKSDVELKTYNKRCILWLGPYQSAEHNYVEYQYVNGNGEVAYCGNALSDDIRLLEWLKVKNDSKYNQYIRTSEVTKIDVLETKIIEVKVVDIIKDNNGYREVVKSVEKKE